MFSTNHFQLDLIRHICLHQKVFSFKFDLRPYITQFFDLFILHRWFSAINYMYCVKKVVQYFNLDPISSLKMLIVAKIVFSGITMPCLNASTRFFQFSTIKTCSYTFQSLSIFILEIPKYSSINLD